MSLIKGTKNYFTPYYYDKALLIQFILSEFFHLHQTTLIIEATKNQELMNNRESIQAIYHALLLLIGPSFFGSASSIHSAAGPLTKLKHYSEHLSTNPIASKRTHLAFHSAVISAWLAAFPIAAYIHSYLLQGTAATHLKKLVKKFLSSVDKVYARLPRLVNLFWQNENVCFFLLQSDKELTGIYGLEAKDQLFRVYKKKGQVLSGLAKKFKKRGFEFTPLEIQA
ncbi:MAG: hypothetical protein LW832_02975 [Parachlamydia sp.]|jgi:hypothetical protein|nr:hypothetical protein [Parachlamydia sp.]